ncbi:MAG: DEAD/DEAH box helicase [Dysgonamonadaceae bacterium]|jgi:SNF2 family DNA or RNA helicase|nr:DEAD/DEAH box helicase [Dysgonamonadaceae bacterium]
MDEKLILLVTEHRPFGWKINLYSAVLQTGDSLRILGRPNMKEEIEKGLDEAGIALLKAADEVSEEALLKAYSRTKEKSKIPQSTIDNLIRPRIEKNCSKILDLALRTQIPLFFREAAGNRVIYVRNRIELLPETSRCLFNFIKDEQGLRYFITLTNGDEEIVLQQQPAIVLSNEPCVVLLGNQIHRVQNIDSKKLLPFFTKTHINVPPSSEKLYLEKFILKTIPKYEVRIEGIEMNEKKPAKQAVLVLEEDFYSRLMFSLFFRYDDRRFPPATSARKRRVVALEEVAGMENICWFDRDLDWEKKLQEKLLKLGLVFEVDNRLYLKQQSEVLQRFGLIDWMNLNLDKLNDFLIEQKTAQTYYKGKISLQSKVTEKIDWFDLEIEVIFDNFKLPFGRFRKHIITGNPEYVLPDGTVFILPEEWFLRYQDFFQHTEDKGATIRMKKVHIRFLHLAVDILFDKDRSNDWKQFGETLLERPPVPEHLNPVLRPYQKEGFYWLAHLRKLHFGGCLADDMGLGKTIQTITLLESIYSQAGEKKKNVDSTGQFSLFDELESTLPASLIIAPTSLLHNWQNEIKKFAPNLKSYVYAGNKRLKTADIHDLFRPYHVVITSYGMVRSDSKYFMPYLFHYLVLDESQYIKNPDSITYQVVKQLASDHKLTLTGTPIENSLSDLWAQFNFINPGLLGNLSFFKNRYINRIKEKDKNAEESLLRLIRPFLLRRTKEEVTPELPQLSQEIVYCDMSEEQERVYIIEKNSIRNQMLENKELFIKNNLIALKSLMRLRLLSNHPALTYSEYTGDSGKFDQILLYFETIRASGHKVLIFSSFVKYLRLLAKSFDEKEWKYAMLTGQTSDREGEIDRFTQNADVNAFFISLKAGGTGLNLTVADYVFIVDPWWNPAAEMQALSRAHRIGQDKKVMAYRFISNDSIEEKILHLQNEKSQLSETFITSNNPLESLNREEIEKLFAD